MRRTRGQSVLQSRKMAADWYELMILQRTMRPSIVHVKDQLNPRFAAATLGLHPVVRKLLGLLISCFTEGRRLSCKIWVYKTYF